MFNRSLRLRSNLQSYQKKYLYNLKTTSSSSFTTTYRHFSSENSEEYDEAIKYCKETGALDPTTVGTVQNIGLMAQKAEEYGSHPTTFKMPADGTVRMVAANGDILHEHNV